MIKEREGRVRAQGQGTPSSLTARTRRSGSRAQARLTGRQRRQARQHGRRLVVSVCLPVPRVSAPQRSSCLHWSLELDGEADGSECAGRGPWAVGLGAASLGIMVKSPEVSHTSLKIFDFLPSIRVPRKLSHTRSSVHNARATISFYKPKA